MKFFVDNVSFKKTGYLFIVDDRGLVISHPNKDLILNPKMQHLGKKTNINSKNNKYNWYIIFSESKEGVYKSSYKFLYILIIMIIITTTIVVLAIYHVSSTNQKEKTKKLEKLAITDSLTNLYNNKTSFKKLAEEINLAKINKQSLVIIMADLDKFKNVNDTYGHQVGDEDNGLKIAQRIQKSIGQQKFSEENFRVTISMGICTWKGKSLTELVKKADELLYKAKRNGRNRIEMK